MKLKLKIFGFPDVEKVIGSKELEVEMDGKTVGDLEDYMEARFGSAIKNLFRTQILRNGTEWIKLGDRDRTLNDGDSLSFLNMITGG